MFKIKTLEIVNRVSLNKDLNKVIQCAVDLRASIVKRNKASLVFGMNIGAFGEEKLDDADAIVAGGEVKRGAVTTLEVAAVDDVRIAEHDLLNKLKVA